MSSLCTLASSAWFISWVSISLLVLLLLNIMPLLHIVVVILMYIIFLNFSCVQLGYVLVGVCVLPTQSSTPIITRYCNLSSQSLSMVILSLAHNIKVKWSFFTQEWTCLALTPHASHINYTRVLTLTRDGHSLLPWLTTN